MPYLGDFLGQIMAELASARMKSDIESIRIAELYADHDLLRHFPVPRIRLPAVEIDVPFVNKSATGPNSDGPSIPSARVVAADFHPKAVEYLKTAGIELPPTRVRKLLTLLTKTSERFEQPNEMPPESGRLSSALANEALNILTDREKERLSSDVRRKIHNDLVSLARKSVIELRRLPQRLEIAVTTDEVREAGSAVTRVSLKVSEEGLEWTTIETEDGKRIDRLVLE
jgi:hypothetical protein